MGTIEKDKCNYDCEKYDTAPCCYDLKKKISEFLYSDTYMLDYKNINKKEENVDRMKVLYSKLFQPYKILKNNKVCKEYNGKYFDIFGIIPLELIPASYIPFNYKNYDMNLDRLKKGEIFSENDYKRVFIEYNEHPDPTDIKHISEKNLKKYLNYCLQDKLNNPISIFNAYTINTMKIILCIYWFFILIMLLYVLFYYYREVYSYILLFTTIILVVIAIIWKMIYILNID